MTPVSAASSPIPSPEDENVAMIDRISDQGIILACDDRQAAWLGYATEEIAGADWSRIYSRSARAHLSNILDHPEDAPKALVLELRRADGRPQNVCAVVEVEGSGPTRTLRTFKWHHASFADRDALAEGKAVLIDILNASDDPSWCIEYAEPVDLSAPEQEIVRQMFENRRHWRFCNAAMGRFYRLPDDQDLNDRPVREIFDRNPGNEAFALFLLRNNFDVVRALSHDTRYDGTTVDVENDVRGLIRNNQLHRMWGTVRDVSKHLRRNDELRKRMGDLELALVAVPEALLLVDGSGLILLANTAARVFFGMNTDMIVGQPLEKLVSAAAHPHRLMTLTEQSVTGALRAPILVDAQLHDGPIQAEVNARRFETRGLPYLAVTLRKPQARMPDDPQQDEILAK